MAKRAVAPHIPVSDSERRFNATIVRRVILIRELSGLTQEEMAGLLGIDSFSEYEEDTPMPAYLWQAFCYHAGVSWTKMLPPSDPTEPRP